MIEVTVHTKANGGVVPECEVWYVPKGLSNKKERCKKFDRNSSPTSHALPPGNYFMWAKRGEGVGERLPVSPGEDGRVDKIVDLRAP